MPGSSVRLLNELWTMKMYVAYLSFTITSLYWPQHRCSNNHRHQIPDESFAKDVIESCAKTYFRSVAGNWKKMQSDEGKQKLEKKQINDRRRNRRALVSDRHLRDSVTIHL
jgi:hypothetical protein